MYEMPMRSMLGVLPCVTSSNHCIVVGSPHIGLGQGTPGALGTHLHSDVPGLRTACRSRSTTVAVLEMNGGAARSASAIFSSVVASWLIVLTSTTFLVLRYRPGLR